MSYFNYDGRLYGASTPIIGPDNRGLRYGVIIHENRFTYEEKGNVRCTIYGLIGIKKKHYIIIQAQI